LNTTTGGLVGCFRADFHRSAMATVASGSTDKGGLGRHYLARFMREQSRTVVG
jgi:uncharacterized membrane protein (UPF0136 family)